MPDGSRRGGITTTRRDQDARAGPDLVDRNFVASAPNQLWFADITFVPPASGFLYLAVVLDAWSRKVAGWAMANHLRAELVVDALEMAVDQRRPKAVVHHRDQRAQPGVNWSSQCQPTLSEARWDASRSHPEADVQRPHTLSP